MNNLMRQTELVSTTAQSETLSKQGYDIHHHGAVNGVTGSCHELRYLNERGNLEGILIDCGLFQGIEAESDNDVGASLLATNISGVPVRGHPVADQDNAPVDNVGGRTAGDQENLLSTNIDFEINHIKALVVTHVHIDHVGRIPYLLAKGFKGPIYCSEPSAHLLPLVLEDALKVGFTRNKNIIEQFLSHIEKQIVSVPYNKWQKVSDNLQIKLKPAGHILGSAYVLCRLQMNTRLRGYDDAVGAFSQANNGRSHHVVADKSADNVGGHPVADKPVRASLLAKSVGARLRAKSKTILFSGDLGAPYSPILKSPNPPFGCDVLVLESTYGDKNHENRKNRRQRLQSIIEKALENKGTVLIPAFSIGRTQELLYELEEIIHQNSIRGHPVSGNPAVHPEIGVGHSVGDSTVRASQPVCPASALGIATSHQDFDWSNLEIIIDSPFAAKFTDIYQQLSQYWDKEARRKLKNNRKPLNYNNVLTISGHQEHLSTVEYLDKTKRPAIVIAASGMCNGGRIMNYLKAMLNEPRHDVLFVGYQANGTIGRIIQKYGPKGGYVDLDGQRITINAKIHTIGGYSAHAGQKDLINFVRRMWKKPKEIRLIHGDEDAKEQLKQKLNKKHPKINTWIPKV